jgi:hypothetical protein
MKKEKKLVHVDYKTGKCSSKLEEFWDSKKNHTPSSAHSHIGSRTTLGHKYSKNKKTFK